MARAICIWALLLALAASASAKLEVVLYAEALCPYCAQAVTDVIGPLADSELGEHFTFRYVAWGNALNTSAGVRCQHGPAECRLDRIINCAIALSPSGQPQWLPFLRCLESSSPDTREEAVKGCLEEAGLEPEAVGTCATGEQGDELERQAALETAALDPPHTYVPWVVVNGVALGEEYGSLWKYICITIQGDKPKACHAAPDPSASAVLHQVGSRRVEAASQASGGVTLASDVAAAAE